MRSQYAENADRIVEFVNDYKRENGIAPSVREIADNIGQHYSSVSRYLARMKSEGKLNFDGPRSIMTKETRQMFKTQGVAVLGSIACGLPKFAEENIEDYVQLPISLIGHGSFFLLHANGDSMINAGIGNGDLVLIRQQNTAESGQIVVALIEDEATLKRYYPEPEKQRIRLHPENDVYSDIYVNDCIIQGVAVKVFKDLE